MTAPTVLVVDDDPTIRILVRYTLEPQGYQVLEAGDAREAMACALEGQVGVAILDLCLGADSLRGGLALCEALRNLTPSPVVIMVTGSTAEADRRSCLDRGAQAFLTKPYSPLQLVDLVRSHLPVA